MSEFWQYFHDRLAWPLIHAPGPLAGLVRGLSLALDSTRDDIVYFRRQWFPELCEAELVPDFGPDVDGEPFLEADNQETTD